MKRYNDKRILDWLFLHDSVTLTYVDEHDNIHILNGRKDIDAAIRESEKSDKQDHISEVTDMVNPNASSKSGE